AISGSCRTATPSQCPTGQYCKDVDDSKTSAPSPGVDGVCTDLPIDRQSCSVTAACAPGALCLSADHLCHAYVIAGESCVDDDECYSGLCDNDNCVTPHDCTTM
ncbi:MAG TPA: Dickkopf N-terminal cysteine-rich domain-containing protein, partial [Polyangiales bacterium]|nr:Dickkopf N-terminal cysteine-rich domain-containing protein [Polyangiales bacterium]